MIREGENAKGMDDVSREGKLILWALYCTAESITADTLVRNRNHGTGKPSIHNGPSLRLFHRISHATPQRPHTLREA